MFKQPAENLAKLELRNSSLNSIYDLCASGDMMFCKFVDMCKDDLQSQCQVKMKKNTVKCKRKVIPIIENEKFTEEL